MRAALAASGLGPDRLELEITESVLLTDNALALRILHELRDLGVRISMDDFGTGYSSLSYLRSFPFDKIKIDKSFLHDSSFNAESVEIIKAVIGLGHSLGMATTVEGVETETQLNLVRAQVKAAARCRGSCSARRSRPPRWPRSSPRGIKRPTGSSR